MFITLLETMILSKILCSTVRKYFHSKRSSQNNFIRNRAIESGGRRRQRGHQHFLEQKENLYVKLEKTKGSYYAKNVTKNEIGKKMCSQKMWCSSRKFFYVLFFVTHSFFLGFTWSSDNMTVIKKKNTPNSLSVYLR